MSIYTVPSQEVMKVIGKYKKSFEDVVISEPAILSGKKYREVVFIKKIFGKFRDNPKEYLYLDENNVIVNQKAVVERLGRLFFYMDAFLNNGDDSIIKALQKEGDIEKSNRDFELAKTGLEIIEKRAGRDKKSGKDSSQGTDKKLVEDIFNKLSLLRGKTNEKLQLFLEKVKEEKTKHEYFNELMLETILPFYKDAMVCNYEKIQLISKGANQYNNIKKTAEKARKGYAIRFNTHYTEPLMKLHYLMSYFETLLRSYGTISTMTYNQYIKLVSTAGKTNADYKLLVLRNKVQ